MLDLAVINDPVETLIAEMGQGSISIELDPQMDNLQGLESYEGWIDRSYQDEVFARTQRAFACYTILEHKLYRHRTIPVCSKCLELKPKKIKTPVDPDRPNCPEHGPVEVEWVSQYENDKEYLDELKTKIGRSTSTIKDYKQALRLAATNFGHTTMEQVLEHGGIDTYVTIKENTVIKSDTAEIVALRNGHANGQEPVKFIEEKLEELRPVDAKNPAEWSYRLKNAIKTRQVSIWFGWDLNKRETVWHKEVIDAGSPTHWTGSIRDPNTPRDVLEYYVKLLKIEGAQLPEIDESSAGLD